jgi:hypothetical protein
MIKFGAAFLLFAVVLFTACQKDDLIVSENYTPEDSVAMDVRGRDGLRDSCDRCFELVFPITLVYPNGTTQAIGSQDSFKVAIKAWHEANKGKHGERPKIQLPFSVKLQDGTVQTITTEAEKKALIETCHPDGPHHGGRPDSLFCFKPVFPVTIKFPDATKITVNSGEEFIKAALKWRVENKGVKGRPEIVFPFTAKFPDGTTKVVNSEDELKNLAKGCRGFGDGPRGGHKFGH